MYASSVYTWLSFNVFHPLSTLFIILNILKIIGAFSSCIFILLNLDPVPGEEKRGFSFGKGRVQFYPLIHESYFSESSLKVFWYRNSVLENDVYSVLLSFSIIHMGKCM